MTDIRPFNNDQVGPKALPTWVPDYRCDIGENDWQLSQRPTTVKHGLDRHYNATGLSRASAPADKATNLVVSGVYVGSIQKLSEPDHNLEGDVSISDSILTGGQWSQVANSCATNSIYEPTGEKIGVAYARLRIGDYFPGEVNAAKRRARELPLQQIPEPGPSSVVRALNGERLLNSAVGDLMTSRIIHATTGQRLFITDTGYMGLCHQKCELGDQAWLLMGSDMPIILRKLDTEPVTYQFKRLSYVHGVMNGELLTKKFKGKDGLSEDEWLNSLSDGLPFETETLTLS